jgi:hypothetical protein
MPGAWQRWSPRVEEYTCGATDQAFARIKLSAFKRTFLLPAPVRQATHLDGVVGQRRREHLDWHSANL